MSEMAGLPSMAMSQTKEDLLKRLDLRPETYALMAKETDVVYDWLVSDKSHMKPNGKKKAPYDWSDIQERAKDDAIEMIAQRGDQYTAYYWNLGESWGNSPNWVAKWFLYHKFRYRDGRNRAQKSGQKNHDKHGSSSKHKHASKEQQDEYNYGYQESGDMGSSSQAYPPPGTTYEGDGYEYEPSDNVNQSGTYYDPVRDV
ncbi:hypothetical protein ONS95_011772 [Cadophora gregata]|uniref:uncharacterized protein n=1 Tax=Cadophora gregata TaxID=51156 RepID=UPI0026DAB708|nr:uncharacterized protein ONS95_011772 [Cadophora gregata]KAK0120369.1 hypothetical protein ONS95_011772 [Cadophora gregata]